MKRLEDRLAAVRGGDPAALRDALRSKTGVLIAAAAKRVAEDEVAALYDELEPAFLRLLERPIERDPGCRGKVAIARALHGLDRWSDEVFGRGVRWVQQEPVWGGREDTAAELRGVCGLAHAHALRDDALDVLAGLLADPERMTRVAAAQAIGDTGRPDAAALVRFKALTGDPEPAVVGACLGSVLALTAGRALDFVAGFLDDDDDARADAAAIVLGESRLGGAAAPLLAWCERRPDARRRVGYLALALLRDDAATGALLDVIREGERADALAAVSALATFRDDPSLAARVREAGERCDDASVRAAIAAALP